MNYNVDCDSHAIIRPSSSSLIQAQSWSCGVGGGGGISSAEFDQRSPGSSFRNTNSNGISSPSLNSTFEQQQQESGQSKRLASASDQQSALGDASGELQQTRTDGNPRLLAQVPRLSLHIPTVYLTRKNPNSSPYHVYQLTIRSSDGAEWSVYRRYSQFHALHHQLKAKEPAIAKLHFPPKRRLNSRASTIVQERRLKLEEYIRCLNTFIEKQPGCEPTFNGDISDSNIGPSSSESSWASVTAALAALAAASPSPPPPPPPTAAPTASATATTSSCLDIIASSPTERSSPPESACSSTEPGRLVGGLEGTSGCSSNNNSIKLSRAASVQMEAPPGDIIESSSSSSRSGSTATNSAASNSARNSMSSEPQLSCGNNDPATMTTMPPAQMTAATTTTTTTTPRSRDSCFIEQASIRSLFHNFISLKEKRSEQLEEANTS